MTLGHFSIGIGSARGESDVRFWIRGSNDLASYFPGSIGSDGNSTPRTDVAGFSSRQKIMGMLDSLSSFVGGSFFKEVKETVMAYFPPDMSPEAKLKAEQGLQRLLHEKEMEANRAIAEATAQLDQRIREQEGTAADLKALPVVGRVVIFLRGLQRPAWGFLTMVMDYQWFFGAHDFTEQQQTAMIVINLLVLGFLFGERTIKNLSPLIIQVFGGKPPPKA